MRGVVGGGGVVGRVVLTSPAWPEWGGPPTALPPPTTPPPLPPTPPPHPSTKQFALRGFRPSAGFALGIALRGYCPSRVSPFTGFGYRPSRVSPCTGFVLHGLRPSQVTPYAGFAPRGFPPARVSPLALRPLRVSPFAYVIQYGIIEYCTNIISNYIL